MNFEDLQKTWQAQDASLKITINTDLLLREVRRNQQNFLATIFRRDVVEVTTCLLMAVLFTAWGLRWHWWSLELLAVCCLFVGGFFVVDRRCQRRRQPACTDTLEACLASSLQQVDHQIWLLKNIFWWYLLPLLIGLGAVVVNLLWTQHKAGKDATTLLSLGATYLIVYGVVFGMVYWVNQYAVRKQLTPRRQELADLLASLQ